MTMPPLARPMTPVARTEGLTDREERFVLRYLVDFDRRAAIDEAGFKCTTDESRDALASRLLNSVKIRSFVVKKKAEYATLYEMGATEWFTHMRLVFLEAYEEHDWAGAVSALREIGKSLGVYEAHERQKHVTKEDVERIERELETRGFKVQRVNAPPHLKTGTGQQQVTPTTTESSNGKYPGPGS